MQGKFCLDMSFDITFVKSKGRFLLVGMGLAEW